MLVLVTYDVNTETPQGRRRLRRVAAVCKVYGQRVQKSVFECVVGESELVSLRGRLLDIVDETEDNLRLYLLDDTARRKVEHYGTGKAVDFEGPLVV